MSSTLDLAKQLIRCPSVTPDDAGCQQILGQRLQNLGFNLEQLDFGDVKNLWATLGESGPITVFAGHTDVVPTGPEDKWTHPPFDAVVSEGYLFGRGSADMKGSLAAMITACEAFLGQRTLRNRIGFLITSDEEGIAINGTKKVMEVLASRNQSIDFCIVGEPTSSNSVGDVIKIGRRGSLSGKLSIHGIQGHIAYPQLAKNPIHEATQPLAKLVAEQWDQGNESFSATSFQISNIHAGTGANNVIPETLEVDFNFRFSTELDADIIKARVHGILDSDELDYDIDWHLSGQPFLTESGQLLEIAAASIEQITGQRCENSTTGGTSDGRFIAPTGTELIELGPCNASIHKIDECVKVADLDTLSDIYQAILERLA